MRSWATESATDCWIWNGYAGDCEPTTLAPSRGTWKGAWPKRWRERRCDGEPCCTESLAVGSDRFVEEVKPLILFRLETEITKAEEGVWTLREMVAPYGEETGPKSEPKADR